MVYRRHHYDSSTSSAGTEEIEQHPFRSVAGLASISRIVTLEGTQEREMTLAPERSHYFIPLAVRVKLIGGDALIGPPTIGYIPQLQYGWLESQVFRCPHGMGLKSSLGIFMSEALCNELKVPVRGIGDRVKQVMISVFGAHADAMPPGYEKGMPLAYSAKMRMLRSAPEFSAYYQDVE